MRNLFVLKFLGAILLSTVVFSCSNELHMELPQGPQGEKGENGLSAYEIWLDQLDKGEIDWDGDTELPGFFLFLKGQDGKDGVDGQDGKDGVDGQDGKDGQNGADGQNGKSAYDIWKEEVAKGIDNPHNPGTDWEKNKNTLQDFWYYLTGANGGNGISAYELWVVEVGKGLENPHKPGTDWDKNKTTTDDFWEYLRGADGSVIVLGSPNVIVDGFGGVEGEYVNPQDGSVTFTVYDKGGNKAKAGTEVKDLPATLNNNVYTVDANGKIRVPREDLPLDATINQRSGSCQVKFAGETEWYESASNTLVPNRVQTRLYLTTHRNPISLYDTYIVIRAQIQRKTSASGSWQFTPSGLVNFTHTKLGIYTLTGKDVDPAVNIEAGGAALYTEPNINYGNEALGYDIGMQLWPRETIETGATWTGTPQYFGLKSSAYGQVIYAESVVDLNPPVQKIPMITDVKAQKVGENLYRIAAKFKTEDINEDYLYSSGYNFNGLTNSLGIHYVAYQLDANAKDSKCMTLKFEKGSEDDKTTIVCFPTSINEGGAAKTDVGGGVPVESKVILECNNQLFRSRGEIGKLEFDASKTGLVINLKGGGSIPVTIVSSID